MKCLPERKRRVFLRYLETAIEDDPEEKKQMLKSMIEKFGKEDFGLGDLNIEDDFPSDEDEDEDDSWVWTDLHFILFWKKNVFKGLFTYQPEWAHLTAPRESRISGMRFLWITVKVLTGLKEIGISHFWLFCLHFICRTILYGEAARENESLPILPANTTCIDLIMST